MKNQCSDLGLSCLEQWSYCFDQGLVCEQESNSSGKLLLHFQKWSQLYLGLYIHGRIGEVNEQTVHLDTSWSLVRVYRISTFYWFIMNIRFCKIEMVCTYEILLHIFVWKVSVLNHLWTHSSIAPTTSMKYHLILTTELRQPLAAKEEGKLTIQNSEDNPSKQHAIHNTNKHQNQR